jgi:hypothetical protein
MAFGNLLRKNYGRVRFTSRRKKPVDVGNVHYTQSKGQIGLDEAIKKRQEDIAEAKQQRKIKRQERIRKIRSGLSRFQ